MSAPRGFHVTGYAFSFEDPLLTYSGTVGVASFTGQGLAHEGSLFVTHLRLEVSVNGHPPRLVGFFDHPALKEGGETREGLTLEAHASLRAVQWLHEEAERRRERNLLLEDLPPDRRGLLWHLLEAGRAWYHCGS